MKKFTFLRNMHRTLRLLAVEILLLIGGARKEHALIANYDIGEERQHEPLTANVTGNHSPRLFYPLVQTSTIFPYFLSPNIMRYTTTRGLDKYILYVLYWLDLNVITFLWCNDAVTWYVFTVFLIILYTPLIFLEIRVIIKISSHPWYPINCDWFE